LTNSVINVISFSPAQPPNYFNTLESTAILSLEKDASVITFKESVEVLMKQNPKRIIDVELQPLL
jgi:hypothetical protein